MESQPNFNHNHRPRRPISFGTLCTAILLVIAGLVLLGFNLGYIPYECRHILISWKMLLIALGVIALANRQFTGGLILICLGVLFLLPGSIWTYWPLLLIVGGLSLLFNVRGCGCGCKPRKMDRNQSTQYTDTDSIYRNVAFNNYEHIVNSSNFHGGDIKVNFGQMSLNLRNVTHNAPDNRLNLKTAFGTTIIYMPAHWTLNIVASDTMCAEVKDYRHNTTGPVFDPPYSDEPQIINLHCSCTFGSIIIRS